MQKFLLAGLISLLFPIDFVFAAKKMPPLRDRRCRHLLENSRHRDPPTLDYETFYSNSFEEDVQAGGEDWSWDVTYPSDDARDPGDF